MLRKKYCLNRSSTQAFWWKNWSTILIWGLIKDQLRKNNLIWVLPLIHSKLKLAERQISEILLLILATIINGLLKFITIKLSKVIIKTLYKHSDTVNAIYQATYWWKKNLKTTSDIKEHQLKFIQKKYPRNNMIMLKNMFYPWLMANHLKWEN